MSNAYESQAVDDELDAEAGATSPPSLLQRLVTKYGTWTTRISGALVDQALFAGSNFVINIALGNWMQGDEYGAFVVVYSWFLLLQNLYDAIMVEPMSIYGAGKYAQQFKRYLGFLFYGHITVGFVVFGILGVAATISVATGTPLIASAMWGAAISAPFILLRWLTRQPFYILSQPHWSAVGGFIYMVVVMAIIFLLKNKGWLHSYTALIALGIGSIAAATFLAFVFLRPHARPKSNYEMNPHTIVMDHWRYGRWSIADRIMGWLPANYHYVILPVMFSLNESGALRAIMNLTLPISLTIIAVSGLLLPSFVRKYTQGGRPLVTQQLRVAVKIVTLFTSAYCVGIVLFGAPLLNFVFNGRFDQYVTLPLLITMGISTITLGNAVVVDAALRATGRIKYAFLAKVLPAIATVTIGTFLLWQFKLIGANLTSIFVNLVTLCISLWFYTHINEDKAKRGSIEEDAEIEPGQHT
ncbi:MAG: hypothetical protein KC546_10825 [Anaerolineae bacterium]|nr:hypothetical protein [Anaerolineae bacterium]MCA9888859.1 hypothetical protein [Anaerolineae bacterium]MCA9891648.1 hypothetical protein [Anaerolineae bacterium]